MLTVPVLTQDHIAAFKHDGYLVVRRAFAAEDMTRIAAWCDEMSARPEESGKHWVYHEPSLKQRDRVLINRIENIAPFHAGFDELTQSLAATVSQLLGEPAVLFKEKINFKMPGGGGFKPHQDSQAGWDAYADYFINVLVSIDEATVENGCLQIVGGHHRQGLFRSWEPLTEKDIDGMSFVPCPTQPGDLIFFDSYAPHGSEPNMSDRIRRLYYATYNRLSAGRHMAQHYADKHKSFPPDIDRVPGREYVFRV